MLKHLVLMKFKPETTIEAISDLEKSLKALPPTIPEIKEFIFGADLRPSHAYDFALVSAFDNVAALERYRVHPGHQAVLKKVRVMCDSIQAVDFEY